ncbi:anti-sigma factor family protein [Cohnella caldifontis]|uniref:anti-sigma factor family protein n=1 Tax=Cohnella caldifontis TaxID=3027471 RepID=UPI0023EB5A95|nr:anti-sigma factor [Cohnella sp. YIM B05605]
MMEHPVEWLSAYLDDEIDEKTRIQVRDHLESCESCAETLRELAEIQALTASFYGAIEPPPELEQSVRQAIGRKLPPRAWFRSALALALADAVCLAMVWQLFGGLVWILWKSAYKISIAAAYLVSDGIGSSPSLYAWAVGLALILIFLSGISLRRLLRSETE